MSEEKLESGVVDLAGPYAAHVTTFTFTCTLSRVTNVKRSYRA